MVDTERKRARAGVTAILLCLVLLMPGCLDILFPPEEEVPLKPGDFAKDYLQDDRWASIVLEWDHMDNFSPDRSVNGPVMVLHDRIGTYLDKDPHIVEDQGYTHPSNQDEYNITEIKEIEGDFRTSYKVNDVIPVHIMYLNGRYDDGNGGGHDVLGLATGPDSIVIFRERIQELFQNLSRVEQLYFVESDIETAVLVHEFGHLLGLVNINYESQRPHEDPEHPHHTINDRSVMYWSVELGFSYSNLRRTPPIDFEEECVDDLLKLKNDEY